MFEMWKAGLYTEGLLHKILDPYRFRGEWYEREPVERLGAWLEGRSDKEAALNRLAYGGRLEVVGVEP